ncbi:MAG: oxidoreductase [Sediminibacterium sp.]|nr:oxidoreductase [Sediminibacterium sp.]
MRSFSILVLCLVALTANAQPTIKILASGKRVSLRGLSVVNDNVVWASGSAGSVARSTDGGNSFTWMTVPGYEKRDFRDIEAFDDQTAVIMAVAEPAVILKTKDGGKNWKKVFEDTTKGMFLDAMDFMEEGNMPAKGVVIGDPINDQLFYAFTMDGGDSWTKGGQTPAQVRPLEKGEAMFASSGTNVQWTGLRKSEWPAILLVTGGTHSRLHDVVTANARIHDSLPIMQGLESTGANSLAIHPGKKRAVVVGGDFAKDTASSDNCVLISFGKKNYTFSKPQTPPHGYRSCVIYLDAKRLLTCGTSGIDVSRDGGKNWELVSRDSFHVCQQAKKGSAVFLAGGNGRIARITNL